MAATLDAAKPGDRILCVSYGSGAGSDAFAFRVTDRIEERRERGRPVAYYLDRRAPVASYAAYLQMTSGLAGGTH